MNQRKLGYKTAILVAAAAGFIIATGSSAAFGADGEYPVAYWGQTHRHFALQIYHALTPAQLREICTHPASTKDLIKSPSLKTAWEQFHQKKRAAFCKSHPEKTWKLLGESPYFMLPPPREGDQK
ncbi:MAG: hypothetical protein ACYCXP_11860 [Leptospirillum sp.]|jgi:hypothetical protein|nr:hypothetical protein [Nitrospiraceae bacterium]